MERKVLKITLTIVCVLLLIELLVLNTDLMLKVFGIIFMTIPILMIVAVVSMMMYEHDQY